MLKPMLIAPRQPKQQQHQKKIVVIAVGVVEVEIEDVVSMVLHRKKIAKIELPQQRRPINKLTITIPITMHIIVC